MANNTRYQPFASGDEVLVEAVQTAFAQLSEDGTAPPLDDEEAWAKLHEEARRRVRIRHGEEPLAAPEESDS